jgi:ACS family hexuronate transporter-like MFS transporter
MFASTVLCYMDRQAIALVGPKIKSEFRISNESFGWVLAAFSLTYALFQVPAGYLADRRNVRWLYAGAVGWWSLAGIAAAFSPTLGALMACRALLGIGESLNWPCALRVTATVLPPADRSLGNGIFNSGAAVGAVLTPLTVPILTAQFGWRTAFIVVGALGFVWVALWLSLLSREKAELFRGRDKVADSDLTELPEPTSGSRGVRFIFLALVGAATLVAATAVRFGPSAVWWGIALLMFGLLAIARALPKQSLAGVDWARSLNEVTRLRRFWVLVIVSVSVNVCWHFLVNWMATYFQEDRRLGILAGGMVSALPFLAADVGNIGGGWFSRVLAAGGMALTKARVLVVALSAALISGGVWVGRLQSDTAIIVVLGAMALGTAAYMANYFAFAQEVSTRHTGLVVGVLGGLGNLFAAGFLPIAGAIKDQTGGFGISFVIVGLLPLVGVAALAVAWGRSPDEEGAAKTS